MALNRRCSRNPARGGRLSFWERPSRALPDRKETRCGAMPSRPRPAGDVNELVKRLTLTCADAAQTISILGLSSTGGMSRAGRAPIGLSLKDLAGSREVLSSVLPRPDEGAQRRTSGSDEVHTWRRLSDIGIFEAQADWLSSPSHLRTRRWNLSQKLQYDITEAELPLARSQWVKKSR
jgi:hypothetical protein